MKMFLISDNRDTYTGMRLAGVAGVVIHERAEAERAAARVLSDPEIGIVLVTEVLGQRFSDQAEPQNAAAGGDPGSPRNRT